ncbi:Yip1 family protein [Usitatibacter palustris]|uniref:Inner membrane protein YohC n=1 Tax=Usitatibacter palustris TaxID=2732487 RepID=A0A6M4HAT6_9PROT|nr:Yip1 family protein [Usitatibacter palustris]QJR15958.1 Inner membrane protein YohC [Usitatibacter palustris]
MNLVDRVKNILLQPKSEWQVIAGETHTVAGLYTGYVMILAAIPVLAAFIGLSLVGLGGARLSIAYGVTFMVVQYLLSLASVYILALIIDFLAPNFGGTKDFMQAMKVAAFSWTAAWVAGIFAIVPLLGILAIVGLYSLYLLYLGLPVLMKTPEDKALPYTVVVILAAIVISVIVQAVAGFALPGRMRGF